MNSLSKHRTLAMMTGFERYTKKTRRAIFLEGMEQVVPWGKLCALIEPHYPKPGKGRRPKELEQMLRIYFPQLWFNLSDPAVEEALYDSATLRQFTGTDLGSEPVPDEPIYKRKISRGNGNRHLIFCLRSVFLERYAKGTGTRRSALLACGTRRGAPRALQSSHLPAMMPWDPGSSGSPVLLPKL